MEVSAEAARLGLTTAIEIGVSTRSDADEAAVLEAEAERVCESERAWETWDCVECYRARKENPSLTLFVDVRPKKAFDRETVKGAINCPAAVTRGTVAEPVTEKDVDGAVAALRSSAAFSKKSAFEILVVVGDGGGDGGYARDALRAFHDVISSSDHLSDSLKLVEMRDGIDGWLKRYTPGGAPRPRYVGYGKDNEETMFTASN